MRKVHTRYYFAKVEIKCHNVMIDGKKKEIVRAFYEKELQKRNQTEFRV